MLINSIVARGKVIKHIKYKEDDDNIARHLVKQKKIKKYEYYICDYCGNEIVIRQQNHKMTGGILEIPESITKTRKIELALCNKCLNSALKELENINKRSV